MVTFETYTQENLNTLELAEFIFKVYKSVHIPHQYMNSDINSIKEWLSTKNNIPNHNCIAKINGEIVGWAAVYTWTRSQDYMLSWHPLVYPFNHSIGVKLVESCLEYTRSRNVPKIEQFLMDMTDKDTELANRMGEMYLEAGMRKGFEWTFMDADLTNLNFELREIPDSMKLLPLSSISNDELWPSYDKAFSVGGDRRYANQTEAQRRENFDSFFDRSVPMEEEASLVLMEEDKVVGFIKIDIYPENTFVHGIATLPEYRGQGLAKYILGSSMRIAATKGHKMMKLEVDRENVNAIKLYERVGFVSLRGSISYIWESK
ncbi:MAG: GNAT family N-acetyltransferase [Candidatus Heimdallarchaeota archaeon]|nr:GNAT family N-acetyltransferase [Candidatus Heimdallarchaeota archaeon]